MSDTFTPAPTRPSAPRFEIVREQDVGRRPKRRAAPSLITAFLGAIRSVVEDAYVSLAQEAMVRSEQLGDARAERRYARSVRANERRRLRAARREHADETRGSQTPVRPKVFH